ncbi:MULTISPECIES: RNA polymerase sigma factor [Thermomonosporaceae]|uniref:RNA polymerase sigma factor n=1 Tax=Thermomonosporaceae TaxID=2012 RepID=UPI00255AEC14|nr:MULTISPECIES: sigma-70 family RNA polymerase sigma factor [Thermomonosporaceae]MDL4777439.1 sigma-70 family RNA polymerase sigma factor [Actinomadura xylanilytica]
MDDERLAQALETGDTGALLQLMDRYAARLYDYCHALLRDQDAAAGALHDALVSARAHVGLLGEPPRFRSWLYALARAECLRRLRDPGRPTERREAPEVEDAFFDAAERGHRLETRQLVHGALSGLRGREREALDLLLRHGLDAAEVGGVLGIGAPEAAELAGEARHRLDDALAAAFIAHAGRDDCPSVAEIAADGEWPLTQQVAHRLGRHIASCPVCTERRDRTVSTARLLQVLPVALMPTDLRGRVLATATDAALAGRYAGIADGAGPFDASGWPLPADAPARRAGRRLRTPPRLLPALAVAAVVLLIVAGGWMLLPDPSGDRTGSASPTGPATAAADPSEPAVESRAPSESPGPTPTATPTPTSATPTPTRTPTKTRRPPKQSPATTPASEPPKPGTLAAGGCSIPAGSSSCTVSVRAVGGPVTWAVTGASGGLSASGGGRLGRNGSASVRVTRTGPCTASGGGSVRFSPGGTAAVSWTCPPDGPGDGDDGDGAPGGRGAAQ